MSGSELFFWQGIHAFEIFHRTEADSGLVAAAKRFVDSEIEQRTMTTR